MLVNSLSKTYAMTGWRVGYCAAPAEVIAAMLLVLQQSSRGPATFVQDAAAARSRVRKACVDEMGASISAPATGSLAALDGIPACEPLPPEGGLFVMVDVRAHRRAVGRGPAPPAARSTASSSSTAAAYGPGGEGTLRVSFAAAARPSGTAWSGSGDGLLRL